MMSTDLGYTLPYKPKELDSRIQYFVKLTKYPGWYVDYLNNYCLMAKDYLFCLSVNDDKDIEVTVKTFDENGLFNKVLECEVPENDIRLLRTVKAFLKKYLAK